MVGLPRPILFTSASTLLMLGYVVLWRFHHIIPFRGGINTISNIISSTENAQVIEELVVHCGLNFQDKRQQWQTEQKSSVIYFVTPTYSRAVQMPELVRLGQTLSLVPAIHWILVEDSKTCSRTIADMLERLGIPYTHMASPMPETFRKESSPPRGVSNRRAALQWIRSNVANGVLYFGDDDNTFDLRLFEEIRDTQYISMFPVGLVGGYAVSAPVVRNGKVIGFYDSWPAERRFAVDMAGFAVNINLLFHYPNATIPYKAGYEEDYFLQALNAQSNDIEVKANNCTQILVWHTRTVQVTPPSIQPPDTAENSSLQGLLDTLHRLQMATVSPKGKKSTVIQLLQDGES